MQTEITFPAGDGVRLPGVLTVPDGAAGPGPALVMIYEAFGMTGEMRRVARDLAVEGYVVLIPDLFARGRVTSLCVARTSHDPTRSGTRARRPGGRAALARRPSRGGRRAHRRDRLLPRR